MPVTVSKPAFNLREALSSLKRRVGIKGAQLLSANTTTEAYSAINPVMFRNKLINGGFDVAQRGVSFTDPGGYTLDRWASQSNPTNTVITQQAFAQNTNVIPGNPKNFFRITFNNSATQAADRVVLMQRVEDYQQFVGRTVVLSGWYRSTVILGGCNWLFQMKRSSGFYDNCSEQADPRGFEIPSSEWQYFERRVLVPKSVLVGQTMTSSASFGITLYYQTCNNTGYMDFANLQLELDQATPFEQRPYATELALCQRYFQVVVDETPVIFGNGYAEAVNQFRTQIRFYQRMRAAPTMSIAGTFTVENASVAAPSTTAGLQYAGSTSAQINFTTAQSTLSVNSAYVIRTSDSGKVHLSAEL